MWEDEVEDLNDASLDMENIDSDRLFDFTVAKTYEQEENVIARQGFTVRCLIVQIFYRISFNSRSLQDELLTSRQPTVDTRNAHRPKRLITQATLWRNNAGFHDCHFPTGEGNG